MSASCSIRGRLIATANSDNSFIGGITTRGAISTGSFGAQQAMLQTPCFVRSDAPVSGIWVCTPNWYVEVNAGTGETSDGGTLTVTGSIVDSNNVFHQMVFPGGGTSGTAAPLSECWGFVPGTFQPNEKIYVRRLLTTTGPSLPTGRAPDSSFGDINENTTTDKTMGGTIVQTGFGAMLPLMLVGRTTRPSASFLDTDSRVFGQGDTVMDASGDWGMLGRPLGSLYAYTNMGVSGDVANGWVGRSARRIALSTYFPTWIGENAINQQAFGLSQLQSDVSDFITAVHGAGRRAGYCSCAPHTTSSNGWTDFAGQTSTDPSNTYVEPFNTWIAGNPAGLDFNLDIASFLSQIVSTQLLFKFRGITADGLHETTQGDLDIDLSAAYSFIFPNINYAAFMPQVGPF